MPYPVDMPEQLRVILRSLRESRGLTQAQLGERLGVSQKRIARIEGAPHLTGFDQISRMVSALSYRLVVEEAAAPAPAPGDAPW